MPPKSKKLSEDFSQSSATGSDAFALTPKPSSAIGGQIQATEAATEPLQQGSANFGGTATGSKFFWRQDLGVGDVDFNPHWSHLTKKTKDSEITADCVDSKSVIQDLISYIDDVNPQVKNLGDIITRFSILQNYGLNYSHFSRYEKSLLPRVSKILEQYSGSYQFGNLVHLLTRLKNLGILDKCNKDSVKKMLDNVLSKSLEYDSNLKREALELAIYCEKVLNIKSAIPIEDLSIDLQDPPPIISDIQRKISERIVAFLSRGKIITDQSQSLLASGAAALKDSSWQYLAKNIGEGKYQIGDCVVELEGLLGVAPEPCDRRCDIVIRHKNSTIVIEVDGTSHQRLIDGILVNNGKTEARNAIIKAVVGKKNLIQITQKEFAIFENGDEGPINQKLKIKIPELEAIRSDLATSDLLQQDIGAESLKVIPVAKSSEKTASVTAATMSPPLDLEAASKDFQGKTQSEAQFINSDRKKQKKAQKKQEEDIDELLKKDSLKKQSLPIREATTAADKIIQIIRNLSPSWLEDIEAIINKDSEFIDSNFIKTIKELLNKQVSLKENDKLDLLFLLLTYHPSIVESRLTANSFGSGKFSSSDKKEKLFDVIANFNFVHLKDKFSSIASLAEGSPLRTIVGGLKLINENVASKNQETLEALIDSLDQGVSLNIVIWQYIVISQIAKINCDSFQQGVVENCFLVHMVRREDVFNRRDPKNRFFRVSSKFIDKIAKEKYGNFDLRVLTAQEDLTQNLPYAWVQKIEIIATVLNYTLFGLNKALEKNDLQLLEWIMDNNGHVLQGIGSEFVESLTVKNIIYKQGIAVSIDSIRCCSDEALMILFKNSQKIPYFFEPKNFLPCLILGNKVEFLDFVIASNCYSDMKDIKIKVYESELNLLEFAICSSKISNKFNSQESQDIINLLCDKVGIKASEAVVEGVVELNKKRITTSIATKDKQVEAISRDSDREPFSVGQDSPSTVSSASVAALLNSAVSKTRDS